MKGIEISFTNFGKAKGMAASRGTCLALTPNGTSWRVTSLGIQYSSLNAVVSSEIYPWPFWETGQRMVGFYPCGLGGLHLFSRIDLLTVLSDVDMDIIVYIMTGGCSPSRFSSNLVLVWSIAELKSPVRKLGSSHSSPLSTEHPAS